MTTLLSAESIGMRFGGVLALDNVSLEVAPGELVGLVGPNGAGKTTLFNIVLGQLRPTHGRVFLDGRDITRLAVHRRARLGVGRTFQRLELFGGMTVRQHLLVADRANRGYGGMFSDLLGRGRPSADEIERADAILERLGLGEVAIAPVESLPLGQGRLVELGRALIAEPRLLLLDEPSSGLSTEATEVFAAAIRDLREHTGAAVLLVEHDLDLVRELAERLYVIDSGRMLASGNPADVLADPQVVEAYIGALP